MRSVVVFPQPEGPRRAKKLPRGQIVEALRDALEANIGGRGGGIRRHLDPFSYAHAR